jgi:nicotinamidase-related amidase
LHFYNQPTPGPLIAGSEGAELVEPLKILPGEIKIIKKRFSAYHGTHLDTILKRLRVNHVVLCGVQLPNCIRATAMDAIQLDYQVTVLSDATASRSNAAHNVNLEDLRQVGVHIVGIYDEDSLLDWLRLYRGELQALTRDERRRR